MVCRNRVHSTTPNSNSWPWDGDWAIRYSDFYKNNLTDKDAYFFGYVPWEKDGETWVLKPEA